MKKIKIHYLQHVPFEGVGYIENWVKDNGHELLPTLLFQQYSFPSLNDFDWLIIMGGPMNVYEESIYSWLKPEKEFIKAAINADKTVIGICLGAQLIATTLGAKVYRNREREIGWFPVTLTPQGSKVKPFSGLLNSFPAFHWHGETFKIPNGAIHLIASAACPNQAFLYKDKVLALQFHLEATPLLIKGMIQHCGHELTAGTYIQNEAVIAEQSPLTSQTNKILKAILDQLATY